jgi:hypothetical protein
VGREVYFLGLRFAGRSDDLDLVLLKTRLDGKGANEISSFSASTKHTTHTQGRTGDPLAVLSHADRDRFSSPHGSRLIEDATVANGCFYAATNGCGIVVFPLDGNQPWTIDRADGLPSNRVQRLAVHERDVYAWAGSAAMEPIAGAYLLRFSHDGAGTNVICSSRRSNPETILDGIRPPTCHFMMIDEIRTRLVFGLAAPAGLDQRAIYQLDLRSDKLSKAVDYDRTITLNSGLPQPDRSVLLSGLRILCRFSLDTDEVSQLYRDNQESWWPAPILLRGDHVWTAAPFGRIHLGTGTFEPFPELREWDFWQMAMAVEIDEEHILLHDGKSIWLVSLAANPSE